MDEILEIEFLDIKENKKYCETIEKVVKECFDEEKLNKSNFYLNIILTNPKNIKEMNSKYRNIDKETDVLSFPMFEKNELDKIKNSKLPEKEVLGDIVISIQRVMEQAEEYNHSFERELAYMVVHGFYHVIGYDHIKEEDKLEMRKKEEIVLNKLKITRD